MRGPTLFLALALAWAGAASAEPPPDNSLLVANVSIVDAEAGEASPPRDILMVDGRIAEIAEAGGIERERAEAHFDGAGMFAVPGLIDVHAHIGDGGAGSQTERDRERALAQFLRYGVTTIFVPGGSGGNGEQMGRWSERCGAGELTCPGLYWSGDLVTAPGSHPITTIFGMPADADPAALHAVGLQAFAPGDDADALVATKVARGASAIKIAIEDGPPPWYPKPRLSDAEIAELARAAHDAGVPVYAHVGRAEHVDAGLAGGIDGIMHAPIDPLSDKALAGMADRGAFFVATLALFDGIEAWGEGKLDSDPFALAGVAPRALAALADPAFLAAAPHSEAAPPLLPAAKDNLKRAAAAGVPLALGTDTNNPFVYPGYSAHEELALMVDAGLTPARALAAATLGGAKFLRREDRIGRIAVGYEADIVILDENPLDDIRATRSMRLVLSDGRMIEPVTIAADQAR